MSSLWGGSSGGCLYVRVQVGVAVGWGVWDGDRGQFDRRHLALWGLSFRSDVTVGRDFVDLFHCVSARLGVGGVSGGTAQRVGLYFSSVLSKR